MRDIPRSENLVWDIPKPWPMNDKLRVSFFVLGYLSLSHPILVLIWFSTMQLVARKSCLAQNNDLDCYILPPTAHAVHQGQIILISVPSTLLRRSGSRDWGLVCCSSRAQSHHHRCLPGRRRWVQVQAEAKAPRSYSITQFVVTGLCHSTCSLHRQDLLVVL
jgi:hypothetical protein